MIYTLPVKELKRFFSESSFIPSGGVLPIYGYTKIVFTADTAILYKTNSQMYFIYEIEVQNSPGELVVHTKKLADFVSNVSTESITLKPFDTYVQISDGKNIAKPHIEPAANFPSNPEVPTDGIFLSEEIVKSLKQATKFINDTPGMTSHVFMGKGHIAASDLNIAFYSPMEIPFESSFYKEMIMALPGACQFKKTGSYFSFSTLKATYLFIEPEIKFTNLTTLLPAPEEITATFEKSRLIEALMLAKSQNENKFCIANMNGNGSIVDFSMIDSNYDGYYETKIDYEGKPFSFLFNVDMMLSLIKQVTTPTIPMSFDGKKFYIKDPGFTMLIIGIVPDPKN